MLLIVILNAVLATTVLGVIVALHAKAIAADRTAQGAQPAPGARWERSATWTPKSPSRAQRRPQAVAAAR